MAFSMMVLAQASSVAAVTLLAQGASFARAAALAVARVAIPSATEPYCSASKLDTDCASASLPNPLEISSGGRALAGCVASPKTSPTVLLYSNRVSRRSGERPAWIPWSGQSARPPVVPPTPVVAVVPVVPVAVTPVPVAMVPVPVVAPVPVLPALPELSPIAPVQAPKRPATTIAPKGRNCLCHDGLESEDMRIETPRPEMGDLGTDSTYSSRLSSRESTG